MSEPAAVGIDIGGTKLVAGLLDAEGDVLDRRRVTSPHATEAELVGAIADLVGALGPGLPVGIGIAGMVDRRGTLRYGPNVGVRDLALAELVGEATRAPVTVRNDASTALYGEYRRGAGEGADTVVMFTLGTGVGGAIVAEGRPLEGAAGVGGELGHMIVDEGGRLCPCGNAGCLEAYASGTAIGRRAAVQVRDLGMRSILAGREPEEIDGKSVTLAAEDGDAFAQEVLREAGFWLGVGAASIVNVLDPDRILVGGGATTRAAPWVLPAAKTAMDARIVGAGHRTLPEIVEAALGDDAGMIGAGLLALDARARA